MKRSILFICFSITLVYTAPSENENSEKLGNPDEWSHEFQSDIKFSKKSRNGLRSEEYRWPNGVVAYNFGPKFDESKKANVLKAMKHYKDITQGCITFKERTTEKDFVSFVDYDKGCWSYIGKQGGRQEINLPTWCSNEFGAILHEMYHALGFFHEQSRADRDKYVTINWENIVEGSEANFNVYGPDITNDFSTEYDYKSLMHYSPYAFTKDGDRTIVTKNEEFSDVIGQRIGLSENDVLKLVRMYDCFWKKIWEKILKDIN